MISQPRPILAILVILALAFGWRAVDLLAATKSSVGTGVSASGLSRSGTVPVSATRPRAEFPALSGNAAQAAAAVHRLATALREGDVASVCRPASVFTPAVVAEMNGEGPGCEALTEDLLAAQRPPAMGITALSAEPDLATVRVVAASGQSVPLSVVRDGSRWLVSFSNGTDPLSALMGP